MESMNNESLLETLIKEIQDAIIEKVRSLLPTIIKPIVKEAISKSENLTQEHLQTRVNNTDNFSKTEEKSITNKNREDWNYLLDKREKLFWQYHRTVRLLDLYSECMAKEKIYIPRKFRQEKRHYLNDEEFSVIKALNLQRFQAECEILKIRKDNLNNNINHIDLEMNERIKNATSKPDLQNHLLNKYETFYNSDIAITISKWDKKIDGMKLAFKNDEENLQKSRPTNTNQNNTINHRVELTNDNDVSDIIIPETQIESPSSQPKEIPSKNSIDLRPATRRKRNTPK